MRPLAVEAPSLVPHHLDARHRLVALRHAALRGCPGLWADETDPPRSIVWLRDAGSQWEAFAAGIAEPAVAWLIQATRGRRVVLAAPVAWEKLVCERLGPEIRVERSAVVTMVRSAGAPLPGSTGRVRWLGPKDREALVHLAPEWALRPRSDSAQSPAPEDWAVAISTRSGRDLVAAAWVIEADACFARIGVRTDGSFQRLGLGRAVVRSLLVRIEAQSRYVALWSTHPSNRASVALAQSLGFADPVHEPLLWWEEL